MNPGIAMAKDAVFSRIRLGIRRAIRFRRQSLRLRRIFSQYFFPGPTKFAFLLLLLVTVAVLQIAGFSRISWTLLLISVLGSFPVYLLYRASRFLRALPVDSVSSKLTPGHQLKLRELTNQYSDGLGVIAIYAPIDLNVIDGSSIWLSTAIRNLRFEGKLIAILSKDPETQLEARFLEGRTEDEVTIITPRDLGLREIDPSLFSLLVREIDAVSPRLRGVVVRGLATAKLLAKDRQFQGRIFAYLTDHYKIVSPNLPAEVIDPEAIRMLCRRETTFLAQTVSIRQQIEQVCEGLAPHFFEYPPQIPSNLPEIKHDQVVSNGQLRIVYSGKVAALWGLDELALLANMKRGELPSISVLVIAGKVSGASRHLLDRLRAIRKVEVRENLPRAVSMTLMAEADIAYCWRPPSLEASTLELSTKLVEAAALGLPIICYPSAENRRLLGNEYPGFAFSVADFLSAIDRLLATPDHFFIDMACKVRANHSENQLASRWQENLSEVPDSFGKVLALRIVGHDLKFVDAFASHLKAKGRWVRFEHWGWNNRPSLPLETGKEAEIVFCEWGLRNAIEYSNRSGEFERVIVRIHQQEVKRASPLARQINQDGVDLFVFVSDLVRLEAIEMFRWPAEKTVVIPNYLLGQEFSLTERQPHQRVILAMVGVVPQRKRLDRALDLLELLISNGVDAELRIKSQNPFTWHGHRVDELDFFKSNFSRFGPGSYLAGRVKFEEFDEKVHEFYAASDFILSPSDFESFHYAVAEGVASGCVPLIWSRGGSESIFPREWVVAGTEDASIRIISWLDTGISERRQEAEERRKEMIERYGSAMVYRGLEEIIFGEKECRP